VSVKEACEPLLVNIFQACEASYAKDDAACFSVNFLDRVMRYYTPGTLHRLAASGYSISIRILATNILREIGSKPC